MAKIPGETKRPVPTPSRRLPSGSGGASGVAGAAALQRGYAQTAGAGLDQFAQNLDQIGQKIQSRDDTISRARDVSSFNQTVTQELWRIQDEEDMSLNETGQKFNDFVSQKRQDILANHKGTNDSRAALEERLTLMSSDFVTKAAAAGLDAKQVIVTKTMTDSFNGLVSSVYSDPSKMREAYEGFDRQIQEMSPAMNPEEEQYWQQQKSAILVSGVQSFVDKGAYAEAEKVLDETPGLKEFMPAQEQLKLRGRIESLRQADIKSKAGLGKKLHEFEYIMGRPATPEERAAIGRTYLGGKTTGDEVAEIEDVLGRPLTEEEIARKAGINAGGQTVSEKVAQYEAAMTEATGKPYKATGRDVSILAEVYRSESVAKMFGGSADGMSLQHMYELAPLIESGTASDDQLRMWEAAATQYTQRKTFTDPDTGVLITVPPNRLPPFAQRISTMLGREMMQRTEPYEGGAPEPVSEPVSEPVTQAPGKTIWGLAEDVAGPIPAAQEFIGKTPVIGELMGSNKATQSRNYVTLAKRNLIKALQNNPRYAEGERKAIEAEINIDPAVWDNPTALRDRMMAVDDALEVREKEAAAAAQNKGISLEERRHARDAYNTISNFREQLGVPPKVYAAEGSPANNQAYQKLQPGQEFIFVREDGSTVIAVKPPEPQSTPNGK